MIKIKKGFTLIELIIVIFIIGLLTTIVTISISGAKSRGRDIKRISEITQLQIALDNYNKIEGQYPESLIPGEALLGSSTGIIFMVKVPINSSYYDIDCYAEGYDYSYDAVKNEYEIAFCLEKKIDNHSNGSKCAVPGKIFDSACEGSVFSCGDQVADSQGNLYNTVQIGEQCWFQENINIGNMIDGLNDQANNSIIEKYCYNNLESNCDVYGGLYSWYEAMQYSTIEGSRGICPEGWHVPTDAEWTDLSRYVVASSTCDPDIGCSPAGDKLKVSSLTSPISWDGNDSSGFTALPAGYGPNGGTFNNLGSVTSFWSSLENSSNYSWGRHLISSYSGVKRSYDNQAFGHSVRCLKD